MTFFIRAAVAVYSFFVCLTLAARRIERNIAVVFGACIGEIGEIVRFAVTFRIYLFDVGKIKTFVFAKIVRFVVRSLVKVFFVRYFFYVSFVFIKIDAVVAV